MSEEQNRYQISRKDARGCFVESLRNSFGIGKIHLKFVKYDMKRPEKSADQCSGYLYCRR